MLTPERIVKALDGRRSYTHRDVQCRVYLRRSARVIDGKGYTSLDLVDITVDPQFRREGVFSRTLSALEIAALLMDLSIVYVESISNPHVPGALERRGYMLVSSSAVGGLSGLDAFKVVSPTTKE